MNKLITSIAAAAALFAAAPSYAGEGCDKSAANEKSDKAATQESRRLSTVDRWRGAPYLRSGSYNDALVRAEALDKSLPVITTTPNLSTSPSF